MAFFQNLQEKEITSGEQMWISIYCHQNPDFVYIELQGFSHCFLPVDITATCYLRPAMHNFHTQISIP